jgi:S-adenosylmethionine synthetase
LAKRHVRIWSGIKPLTQDVSLQEMSMAEFSLFTSESVGEGHPDKVADAVSDAVLDHCLTADPMSRVACETLVTTNLCVVAGEVTTGAELNSDVIDRIARAVITNIGYDDKALMFSASDVEVRNYVHAQSAHIAMGVDTGGAGDQGMMFGYACDETPELMPLPIAIAHRLTRRQAEVRRAHPELGFRPDAKSQVTMAYDAAGRPHHIDTLVFSTQHDDRLTLEDVKALVEEHLFAPVLAEVEELVTGDIIRHINPTGLFVIGGPHGDTGLTGRKIIVDTYGGYARHGGGAFSGKDPTKVDRSAAYAARYLAKNVVKAGLATRCEIQLAYAIGVAQPVSVRVDTWGTAAKGLSDLDIAAKLNATVDLTPAGIIRMLDLRRPIYRDTARNGHFGHAAFPWENTDLAEKLA